MKNLDNKEQSLLVGCDTIHKAVAYAKSLPTVEEALSWIVTWEHERALKSETLETFFDFAIKEVTIHFTETKIAFWRYDKFPFLLHSPIEGISDSSNGGSVKLTKYGGMVVKPTYILPEKQGEEFAKLLYALSERKNQSTEQINKECNEELNNIYRRYSGYKT